MSLRSHQISLLCGLDIDAVQLLPADNTNNCERKTRGTTTIVGSLIVSVHCNYIIINTQIIVHQRRDNCNTL